jgi:hypothetical protein
MYAFTVYYHHGPKDDKSILFYMYRVLVELKKLELRREAQLFNLTRKLSE